jgi:DMSO reductase anchor subunit
MDFSEAEKTRERAARAMFAMLRPARVLLLGVSLCTFVCIHVEPRDSLCVFP